MSDTNQPMTQSERQILAERKRITTIANRSSKRLRELGKRAPCTIIKSRTYELPTVDYTAPVEEQAVEAQGEAA